MMIAYLIGALLFGFAAWLAFGVWRIGAVSSGEEIGDRSGAALLLIDLVRNPDYESLPAVFHGKPENGNFVQCVNT